jgi:hypothetical protein
MRNWLVQIVFIAAISINAQSHTVGNNLFPDSFNYHYELEKYPAKAAKKTAEVGKINFIKKNIKYSDHLFEASSFRIPLIADNFQLDELIREGKLVEVPEEGDGYIIQKLTHSHPVLITEAYDALKEITDLFFERTSKKLSISSLTRTEKSQNRLRRVNSNAAKGDSSHTYGAAFDISYSQYNGVRGRNLKYERILEQILDKMVTDGKIYYIKEKRQPCFHVTIRNQNLNFPADYPVEDFLEFLTETGIHIH